MRRKTSVVVPLALITDGKISASAKIVYAVLKSFQTGKFNARSNVSVVVSHAEISQKSNFSKHTVTKDLYQLAAAGWIRQEENSGSANRYFFVAVPPPN